MNENINLCEILKDCPKGTKLFSYLYGEVEFHSIDLSLPYPIIVEVKEKRGHILTKTFSKEGLFFNNFNGICTLVPSLEQPDWNKWKCPKPKFDPKTLKPFDRVLIKFKNTWFLDFFSHLDDNNSKKYTTIGTDYVDIIIPYNDETKHLVGTSDEAPDFYKYWED